MQQRYVADEEQTLVQQLPRQSVFVYLGVGLEHQLRQDVGGLAAVLLLGDTLLKTGQVALRGLVQQTKGVDRDVQLVVAELWGRRRRTWGTFGQEHCRQKRNNSELVCVPQEVQSVRVRLDRASLLN